MSDKKTIDGVTVSLAGDQIKDLLRFHETTEDGQDYDVSKEGMKSLACIGAVRWCGGSRYEFTDVGMKLCALLNTSESASCAKSQVAPDPVLCKFYDVTDWSGLVRELVGHVAQLQDSAKRNVKPWEDTFPPTLLPAYIDRVNAGNVAAQPQGEPILIHAVAVTRQNDDGMYLEWLLEGGICELELPGQILFAMPEANDLCADDGSAEIYTRQPEQPSLVSPVVAHWSDWSMVTLEVEGKYRTYVEAGKSEQPTPVMIASHNIP